MSMLTTARQSFAEFWSTRAPRERTMLATAAIVIALALAYALLLDPVLSGRKRLAQELPALRLSSAQLQALAKQAGTLAAKPATPAPALTREGIETAMARNGLKPQSLTLAGGAVQVRLTSASFAGMLRWLDEMQQTMRLSVTEANMTALAQPDAIDAALTLRQPQE